MGAVAEIFPLCASASGFTHDLPHLILVSIFFDQRHHNPNLTVSPERVADVDDIGTRELIFTLGDARLLISCSDLAGCSMSAGRSKPRASRPP